MVKFCLSEEIGYSNLPPVSFRFAKVLPLILLLAAAVGQVTFNVRGAISYLDNLNIGNIVENGSIAVATPAKVAIGFDVVTPQNGSWSFTIRIFNPDLVPVNLSLFNNNTPGTFFTDEPGVTSPFALGSPSFTQEGGADRYTVSVSGSGLLSAGRYWLVGSTSGAGNEWDWLNGNASYDVNGGSPDDATFFGVRLATGGGDWNSSAANTLSLRLGVTPVPEPVETGVGAALFLIACCFMELRRRATSRVTSLVD